jgi:hypothetical protein
MIMIPMVVVFSLLLWKIFTKVLQPNLNQLEGKLPDRLHSPDLMLIFAILESYVLISLIVCLMSHAFKSLKSWREQGLVFYLILGFGIGLILGITIGMVAGQNLGILAGLLIGIIFGIISGLKEEWSDHRSQDC